MTDRTVKVGRHRLRVRQRGDGEPLLLIHGLGAHLDMWGPVESALASRRLITIDLPGMGKSKVPLRPLHICEIADIVEQALRQLGSGRIDVLGYSLGRAVAQTLAIRHPARIRRLALVSTIVGVGGIPGSLAALAALATATVPLRYWWPWFYEKSYVWTVGGPPPTPEAMSAQIAMRMAAPPSIVGYAWQWLAAINWTSLGWLERIAHPTLVISGDDDRLVPFANSLNLAIRIPNVRLFLARGEGHMLLFDPGSAALAVLTDYFGAATLAQAPVWRRLVKPESGDYRAAVRQRFGPGWAGAACAQANLGLQRVLSIGLPRPLGGSFRRR